MTASLARADVSPPAIDVSAAVIPSSVATPLDDAEFARAMTAVKGLSSLALAVSGGLDSMSLLLLAAHWRRGRLRCGEAVPRLIVASVDHGLRAAAAAEVRQVARLAREHGLEAEILTGTARGTDQESLRELRYGLLCDWCRRRDIGALLLAHQLEDQAETFLLRLGRGSGVDGLAAMARDGWHRGVRVYRPLLDVPRARLRALLRREGVAWLEDPGNRDMSYARVRVRALLRDLAREGMDARRLARTAAQMRRARVALEEVAEARLRCCAQFMADGSTVFAGDLLALPDEIALRALARVLMMVGGKVYRPRLQRLERLLSALRESPQRGRTLHGCRIFFADGSFFVVRE